MSNTPVITVAELASMIANGDKIVVADCRFDPFAPEAGPAAYVQGHIRGAHYLHLDNDLAGPSGETGGGHPVPSPEDFTALMRGIGVDDDSLLVAYDGGGLATASRLWWLARYFGHANVVVLNGGMSAWQAAGHEQVVGPLVNRHTKCSLTRLGIHQYSALAGAQVPLVDSATDAGKPVIIEATE